MPVAARGSKVRFKDVTGDRLREAKVAEGETSFLEGDMTTAAAATEQGNPRSVQLQVRRD